MGVTLVSISKLAAAGYAALFRDSVCRIFNPQKKLVGEIPISNSLYCIRCTVKQPFAGAANATEVLTMEELHTCLSHVAPSMIHDMLTKGMVEGVKLDPMHSTMGQCKSCEYGKAIRKPIRTVREPKQCEQFGDKVHTDLWGPSDIQTPGHKKFYVLFTDDYTRYTHLYLLTAKSDIFDTYKTYMAWAKTQHGTVIKRL